MSDPGRAKLSVPEAAEYLGVSVRTFYEHVRPGLPAIRIGARVVFDPEDLDKWAELQKVAPRSDGSLVGPGTKRLPRTQPAPAPVSGKTPTGAQRRWIVGASGKLVRSDLYAPLVSVDPVSKRLVLNDKAK